jgi:TolA-binding protein
MRDERLMKPAVDADEADALKAIGWQPANDGSVCPDSSLLLAADDGVLDEGLAERVRAHLTSCAACQLLAKDLAIVFAEEPVEREVAGIRARIATGQQPARPRSALWFGLGGLALAAGLLWFMFMPRSATPPAPDSQIARVTPPVPSVFVVDRPAIPPGDVDLTVRGDATKVSLPNQIAAALDKADAGDVTAASSELAAVVVKHPASRSAALALGAVQLRANQNADAAAILERARALSTEAALTDEVDWFLGMALVRTGNRDRARTLLEGICKRGGARRVSACAGVAEIDRTAR